MDTKLPLSLDREVFEAAKKYAKKPKTSISGLVEQYLSGLASGESRHEPEISQLVKSLSGLISQELPDTSKSGYREFLEEKYK